MLETKLQPTQALSLQNLLASPGPKGQHCGLHSRFYAVS